MATGTVVCAKGGSHEVLGETPGGQSHLGVGHVGGRNDLGHRPPHTLFFL